jgi:hypothetical protein
MKELYFTVVKSETFRKAIVAVVNAFGCMAINEGDKINILTFFDGDAEIIKETLQEVGSSLISEVDC